MPVSACGFLGVPALTFTAATIHPQDTSQAKGTTFPAGTTVALKLDLQGAVAGSTIASAQSRLLTTSVTLPPPNSKAQQTAGFGPVSIFTSQLADAGQTFRLTATAPGGITASVTVPVKVKVTMIATTPNPQFEGLNATLTVQLIRSGNPGPMTGTVTANLGGEVQTKPVNSTSNSGILSFPKTNVPAGNLTLSYSYSGDTLHEAATASASFLVVSRTPVITVGFSPPNPSVGSLVFLSAQVKVATPFANAPAPTGTVTFLDHGAPLATGAPTSGTSGFSSFQLPFTPLTVTPIALTATYSGDATYHTVSPAATASINVQRATPTLQFDSAPATFSCGSPTTVTADLAFPPTLGLINRNVSLSSFANQLVDFNALLPPLAQGSLALSTTAAGRATATLSATLPKNAADLQLFFSGDALLTPIQSQMVPIHVQPAPVSIQFTSTPQGGGATLSAVVNAVAPCSGPPGPSGSVTFLEGTTILGVLVLPGIAPPSLPDGSVNTIFPSQNGVSVTVARPAGPHTFVARYAGDQFHQAGTSTPITVTFQ